MMMRKVRLYHIRLQTIDKLDLGKDFFDFTKMDLSTKLMRF